MPLGKGRLRLHNCRWTGNKRFVKLVKRWRAELPKGGRKKQLTKPKRFGKLAKRFKSSGL